MANVYVQTEECYREQERRTAALFPFIPMTKDAYAITANQLVDVLNSAAEYGPDRNYVLVKEK
jgi:hypothetical protein